MNYSCNSSFFWRLGIALSGALAIVLFFFKQMDF